MKHVSMEFIIVVGRTGVSTLLTLYITSRVKRDHVNIERNITVELLRADRTTQKVSALCVLAYAEAGCSYQT